MLSAQHCQRGDDPPGIADVGKLLRTTVEASRGQLPLAQPPAEEVGVDFRQLSSYREKTDAAVNQTSVTLGFRLRTESTVEVLTAQNEFNGFVNVDAVQPVQKRERCDSAERKPETTGDSKNLLVK